MHAAPPGRLPSRIIRRLFRERVRDGTSFNGLKEFLFQLDGIGRGHLLDMGAARQTTLNFFIDRGFKVYTDDLLTTWKIFLDADEQRKKELSPDADRSEMTPAGRAERFLQTTLQYPEGTFDAVLLWDILDYLDTELMTNLAAADFAGSRRGVVFAVSTPASRKRFIVTA